MSARRIVLLVFLFFLNHHLGSAREIAIVGATVIDGTGRTPIPNATLIIGEDGKIRQVGAGVAAPAGAEVVNAQGKYLIPGLWDMHVHYRGWHAPLFLHYGVTTIQDVGNFVEWILAQRDGIAKGKIVGPRIFACGATIGAPKGFQEVDGSHFQALSSTEDTLRVAREMVAQNVDCLKAWFSITPEQVKALGQEARRAGKPLVGHVNMSAITAVEAGVQQLAHVSGVALASMKDSALAEKLGEQRREAGVGGTGTALGDAGIDERLLMDPQKTQEVLKFLLQKGTFLEPDLATVNGLYGELPAELYREWFEENSLLFQDPNVAFIPENHRQRDLQDLRLAMALAPAQRQEKQKAYRNIENFLKEYAQAGGKVLNGTDTSSQVLPGISTHREMELLVRAGLNPMQVIQASSYNGALFYHKENELGSLQPGRWADLVVLDADPLADIRNTRKIAAVYKEGKLVDRTLRASFSNPIPTPRENYLFGPRMPKLRRLTPWVATQGDASVEITLSGSAFTRESVVSFDGHSLPAQWVSSTELKLTVPGELLIRAGTFPVIVTALPPLPIVDPLHEDGRSNVQYFIVKFQ